MKIALIIIAYLILGLCSALAFMVFEYKTNYSHCTPEEFYGYEVEDVEVLYILICLFWPLADIGILLNYGTKYLVKSSIYILKYICFGGSDEEK